MEDFTMPDKTYLSDLLENEDFIVVVALDDGEVVGGLTVYVLRSYYESKPVAYIYDVGVHKDFQRKGIGLKLIEFLLAYCKENKFAYVYVEAEADDLDAIRFYEKTNSTSVLQATHFTYMTN